MAALTSTALLTGATVYGARTGADAAKDAARTQGRGIDAGIQEQRRQFDTALQLQAGERFRGNEAGNALARMLGLRPFDQAAQASDNFSRGLDPSGNSLTSLVGDTDLPVAGRRIVPRNGSRDTFDVFYGDQDVGDLVRGGPNGRFIGSGAAIPQPVPPEVPVQANDAQGNPLAAFLESPDYQFRRTEGTRDIQNQFAARGGAQSGNALRALAEFNSGLASGEFNNRFNRLATLAGFGNAANSQGAQNAINTGRGVAAGLQDAGAARASGVAGSNQAFQEGLAGLAGTLPLFQDALQQNRNRRNANALAPFAGLGGLGTGPYRGSYNDFGFGGGIGGGQRRG